MASGRSDRQRWAIAAGLLVGLSAITLVLALTVPFEPSAPAPAPAGAPRGDAARGAAIASERCGGCHQLEEGGSEGVGPALVGSGLSEAQVAAVIAAGRGAMPAGIVSGQEAADVAAYVAQIAGGVPETPTATATGETEPDVTVTTEPTAPEEPDAPAPAAATARFLGPDLEGIRIDLDVPAPPGYAAWVDGPDGLLRIGLFDEGATTLEVPDLGEGTIIDRYDEVLVGIAAQEAVLGAALDPTQRGAVRELLIRAGGVPEEESLLTAGRGQIDVLRDHIRFLRAAQREGNFANVRFHGEHLVNIILGDVPRDLDGNGDPSNPGDGVGLLGSGGRGGYVPRILDSIERSGTAAAVGEDPVRSSTVLRTRLREVVRDATVAARAGSLDESAEAVATIVRAEPAVVARWREVARSARDTATLQLTTP